MVTPPITSVDDVNDLLVGACASVRPRIALAGMVLPLSEAAPLIALEPIARAPDIVPPVSGRSSEACPAKDAVMVPARKLPLPSRATTVEAVLALVASR